MFKKFLKFVIFLSLISLVGLVLSAQRGFQGNPDRATVWPKAIDDVLYNPGMGFTTMGAFNGDIEGYPKSTISYWRWYWETIEPENGVYRWDIIDETIKKAKSRGQRVALGIMPANGRLGAPKWYKDLGAKAFEYIAEESVKTGVKSWMPDHNDPLYLKYMGRLVEEFAKRYDGNPDIDHIDMRSLGHWGEWHFSFIKPTPIVKPEIRRALVDIYINNFKRTPILMLIGGKEELTYAINKGTGWRADCLGDLGFWGSNWNHMKDYYQQALDSANANDAWKHAPVAFESCGVMQNWADKGYDIDFIFDEALRWHCSIFNNKSSAVSPRWWSAVEKFLKKMGYRFAIQYITHPLKVKFGGTLKIESVWENQGVAPPYRNYIIAFKLQPLNRRGGSQQIEDPNYNVDVRKWLPGKHNLTLDLTIPTTIKPNRYLFSVAFLDPDTKEPSVSLAIEGRDGLGWYSLSEVEITE
jgi:hypothetical protein